MDVDQTWQASARGHRGDPLEVVNFRCGSGVGCGFTITFPLPLTQRIDPAFYDVFWLDRGRHRVSLQLCYRDLRNNAGISTDFELSDHIYILSVHSLLTFCGVVVLDGEQEVKVIWQKAPHGGPIPRLGVTPGGRKLYYWIPGVGFPISVP